MVASHTSLRCLSVYWEPSHSVLKCPVNWVIQNTPEAFPLFAIKGTWRRICYGYFTSYKTYCQGVHDNPEKRVSLIQWVSVWLKRRVSDWKHSMSHRTSLGNEFAFTNSSINWRCSHKKGCSHAQMGAMFRDNKSETCENIQSWSSLMGQSR